MPAVEPDVGLEGAIDSLTIAEPGRAAAQTALDVNLLGLADLLRRTRARRQLMVSTHDDRLAGLLQRKLWPVGEDQRTTVITFEGATGRVRASRSAMSTPMSLRFVWSAASADRTTSSEKRNNVHLTQ